MFTNILLLSLLSITCGITNGEDSNQSLRGQQFGLLDVPMQQQREELSFFKMPRAIRAPFKPTEMMTARGYGKRGSFAGNELKTARGFGKREEFDQDMEYGNDGNGIDSYPSEERYQRPFLFPFFQDMVRYQKPQAYVAVPKRNDLKFRLSDGSLRIGRGFGKRSYFLDVEPSNSDNSGELMKAFSDQNSNQQLKPKESKDEET